MKVVLQEVIRSSVEVDGKEIASIGKGYLLLVSFTNGDDITILRKMAEKIVKLRIWPDENGKTNWNIEKVDGDILSVSQFTLYANCNEGNRPSFVNCMEADKARQLFAEFNNYLSSIYRPVKSGQFQADMKVNLINDGPFTLVLNSEELFK